MSSAREVDVVVIGAGPAGEVAAGRCADGGLEVALVESRLVGGECSYWGCMPSKALLRPAQAIAEARRIPGAAEAITGALDVPVALARRDEVIHDLDDAAQLPWLEDRGVQLVRGHARLDGERTVRVGDDVLRARRAVVVATGTAAAIPPIPGLREAQPWTNHEITTAHTAPARLIVLGGGVIGVEMAQAWSTLGSRVAVVEALPRLLAREEEFAAEQVADALRAAGVDVRTGVEAVEVRRPGGGDGPVTLVLEDGAALEADELLCAVGRRQMTDDLGLDTVGLRAGEAIEVTDAMAVAGMDWLYAVVDVNRRALLTHMGKYQARAAADRILGRDAAVRPLSDGPLSPRVTFTDPQVAAVGHTLMSAREAGLHVRAVDVGTSANAGGSFYGRNAPGTARMVVDEHRRVIVGFTVTGPEVQDFLHAATIAVVAEVPLDDLWHAAPVFPTRSELWLRLLESYGL
jgi:dihydrolipoamide dehydrogenase